MNNSISKIYGIKNQLLTELDGLFDAGPAYQVRRAVMRCRKVGAMRDLAAYIRIARQNKTKKEIISFNVAHDIFELDRNDKLFIPRSHGYADRERTVNQLSKEA